MTHTNPSGDNTEAQAQVIHPSLKELEFRFPLVNLIDVDWAIANVLSLSTALVHTLNKTLTQTQPRGTAILP